MRELRLIAEHRPGYNRRSTRPEKAAWLKVTDEPVPRLSVVPRPGGDHPVAAYVGLFSSRARAQEAVAAVHTAFDIRRCTPRLSRRGGGTACALAGMGRCSAPCVTGPDDVYGRVVDQVRSALAGDLSPLVGTVMARVHRLSDQQRYEEAAAERDRLAALVRGVDRAQQVQALTATGELIAARRQASGGLGAGLHPPRPTRRHCRHPGRRARHPHARCLARHRGARRGATGARLGCTSGGDDPAGAVAGDAGHPARQRRRRVVAPGRGRRPVVAAAPGRGRPSGHLVVAGAWRPRVTPAPEISRATTGARPARPHPSATHAPGPGTAPGHGAGRRPRRPSSGRRPRARVRAGRRPR